MRIQSGGNPKPGRLLQRNVESIDRPGTATRYGVMALLIGGVVAPFRETAGQGAERTLSFAEALSLAEGRNERILAADAAVDRARSDRRVAQGRRFPDVTLTGRTTRINDEIVIDLDPIRQVMLGLHPGVPSTAIPPFQARIQRQAFNNAGLSATMPVFTGGRLRAGVRAADAAVTAAEAGQRSMVGEVATELAQRYFGLQLAIQNRATRQASWESLGRHVERARSLERNGQIARAERLRAEVALAEADRDVQQAESDEQLARLALSATLAMDVEIMPETPLFKVPPLAPVDSFKAAARDRNPILARLASEQARARQGIDATRGEFLPSLGLFAQRELYTHDLTITQPVWAAGVQLSLPLFQGGQRFARLAGARAQARQVELLRIRAQRDIELLVEQRYRQVEQARIQLTSLEATRTLAEESLRAQQLAFAAGLATSLDVVDAEQALARVQLGMFKALHDADVSLAALLESIGQPSRLPEYINAERAR